MTERKQLVWDVKHPHSRRVLKYMQHGDGLSTGKGVGKQEKDGNGLRGKQTAAARAHLGRGDAMLGYGRKVNKWQSA